MLFKQCIFTIVFAVSTAAYTYTDPSKSEEWKIKTNSTLNVVGKTNINSFTCSIDSYNREDTLKYESIFQYDRGIKVRGNLVIEVDEFDCKHRVMTRDLQKTLRSDEYPHMQIKFISFTKGLNEASHEDKVKGLVEIGLAGKVKNYEVNYQIVNMGNDQLVLIGYRPVLFTDFGLKPPSKLGGIIKVENELEVEFRMFLTRV
ncbi:MAG TPA: hypothetical protein PKC30_00370 [Saprospiraceae bacterium]|nr:hypothetical protein [Saprospiraceae bacterium]